MGEEETNDEPDGETDIEPDGEPDVDPDVDADAEPDGETDIETDAAGPAIEEDRRRSPYSGESSLDVDPVEPPERHDDGGASPELPEEAIEEAERLTRLARRVGDEAEAAAYRERRTDLLAEHDYAALVRDEEGSDVLVCHPVEWLDESDAVDPAAIDAVDRAVEVPLEGADDPTAWDRIADRNEALATEVRSTHGDVHGANADALAAFASDHHAKPVAALTGEELRVFREEYYVRNVWPTDEQAAALERSIELVYESLDVPQPEH